ncbi:MAG TPA: ferritin family protein [Bacteroidales bacterium]|mgnify:FL=1|nr:ferritin family protein [Bacteroidales bacterium]
MKAFESVNEILDFAIAAEQDAVVFYQQLASEARQEDMKRVFEGFAGEEMIHKARLIRIKEEGSLRMDQQVIMDLNIGDYLTDVEPHPGITYAEALVIAMKKEKAAFKLYMDLASYAGDPEMEKVFISLAQEESKHKLRFELEYDEYVLREN